MHRPGGLPLAVASAGVALALTGPAPVVHAANHARAHATSTTVRSDFNGDGMRDLAIGAPTANVGGEVLAGEVHVLYGGAMGLTATGAQRFSLDTPLVPGDPERGQFGTALASGDFDGDGYADLAVGAPLQRVGDYDGAGSITVIPGSPSGLTARGSRTWTENAKGLPVSAGWEDQFGEALAAGDFGR